MNLFVIAAIALALAGGASSPAVIPQTASSAVLAAPQKLEVYAPFAQQLILKIKAKHPEIQKLGLHTVPPGQTQSARTASTFPEKIGKLSSPGDLQMIASGQPKVNRIDRGQFWDTFVPVHDHRGKVIGFLVMEVPFKTSSTEVGALAEGARIRNEVEAQVPTLETLFGPTE